MRVWISGITAIIIIALWVALALIASILILPSGVVSVAGLVRILVLVRMATISAGLGEFRGGLCIRRLNSRRRSGVAARVNLLEVHWRRDRLCCLLLIAGVVHHLSPIYAFTFWRSVDAHRDGRRGSLRHWLSRLIHRFALISFFVGFLGHSKCSLFGKWVSGC